MTCDKCNQKGIKGMLESHRNNDYPQRPHTCQHCGTKDTYAAITGPHDRVCPKKPVSCDKCDWKGIQSMLHHHRNHDCPHRPHSCRYCGTRGTYAAITGPHLLVCLQRPHSCQYCGARDTYAAITGPHDKVCLKKPVSCDKCDWKGIRSMLHHHRNNDCLQRPHSCKYCGTRGTYAAITGPHLLVCLQRPHSCQYCGARDTYAALTGPHAEVCQKKPVSCDKCDWKGIKSALDSHRSKDCPQRPFMCLYCGEKGTYKAITGLHDAVCKKKPVLCPHSECDSRIQRQGIKRHLENCSYEEILCKYAKLGCGTKVKRKDALKHEASADAGNHKELALQTTLRLHDIVSKLNITCSPATFALSGYTKRKAQDRVVIPPPFYTSHRGYNVALEIHMKNREIEALFVQMKQGLHNSKLKWPFTGKVTIELLNQIEDQNHAKLIEFNTESIAQRDKKKFDVKGCLSEQIQKSTSTQYLKDDTLFFRVTVEAFSHKSWLECTENNGH